jgi:NAD(P)-dependent dehydrogenase (short-subunit alcohol dehydrogenase family)
VFIGSVSALRPSPGSAAYGAAKAAVLSLASSLAVEWAPKVRVVAVSPGLVKTEQSHLHYGDDAGIAAVGQTIPAGRMAEPSDVAQCLSVCRVRSSQLLERHQFVIARRWRETQHFLQPPTQVSLIRSTATYPH